MKIKHIYHLYVVESFDARGRDTDLLNVAFKTRKLSNFYSVSQTIIEQLKCGFTTGNLKIKTEYYLTGFLAYIGKL